MKRILAVVGNNSIWLFSGLTVALAIIFGVAVLNPLWTRLAIPGLFPSSILPPITAPIDGIYYIRNAEYGYSWNTQDPLSLWFHPLLSLFLRFLPSWLPPNIWFWIISILFATGCVPLIYHFASILSGAKKIPLWILPLCLLAPGGLGMATGNAELPTLFFVLALLLSVLVWKKWWLTLSFAALAILTKPNSLYMVPILLVYSATGLKRGNKQLWQQALIGIVGLLLTWLLWMWLVDCRTGEIGAYWRARVLQKYYLGTGDIETFLGQLLGSYLREPDLRDQIRFTTALLIPLVNFVIIGLIPLTDETHRYAMAAGNLAMLAIALYMGNPNKIIVYTTTLPAHFAIHLLLLTSVIRFPKSIRWPQIGAATAYSIYCLAMLAVYVFGTPQRWYH